MVVLSYRKSFADLVETFTEPPGSRLTLTYDSKIIFYSSVPAASNPQSLIIFIDQPILFLEIDELFA